ncbi:hypothetical protein G3576_04480 [Roseomonas stagni]|uniref:Uncharacterized protein n=1 Tax=Falsiroseomonas algicola TaxID=2716930 RepID=A0A6M1LG65_9PROT|nr:hypothetical protein [Falsiroseomonas algicola]NGM19260.1 hypothetical protein [Falsiroseomonas algicola]
MRKTLIAIAAITLPALQPAGAAAQEFDSGWRRIAPAALGDLELNGGGVRLNNFVLARADQAREGQPVALYSFSATAVKQTEARRSVRVELVGVNAEREPTVTAALVFNMAATQPNRTAMDTHRFPVRPADLEATDAFFIRVMIP